MMAPVVVTTKVTTIYTGFAQMSLHSTEQSLPELSSIYWNLRDSLDEYGY